MGEMVRALALEAGVCEQVARSAIIGRTWRHVQ